MVNNKYKYVIKVFLSPKTLKWYSEPYPTRRLLGDVCRLVFIPFICSSLSPSVSLFWACDLIIHCHITETPEVSISQDRVWKSHLTKSIFPFPTVFPMLLSSCTLDGGKSVVTVPENLFHCAVCDTICIARNRKLETRKFGMYSKIWGKDMNSCWL